MDWWLTVLSLISLYTFISLKTSPQVGLAIVVPVCWLFPAWLILPLVENPNSIVATGLDVKVTVGTVCLVIYCFLPGRNFPTRLVPSDIAMLGLFATHILSDLTNEGWSWSILGRACVEWYVPYVVGRVAFQSKQCIIKSWKVLAVSGALMACAAATEAVLRINVFELAYGIRPVEGAGRDYTRWGMRRAFGPTLNPIYFGVVQILCMGWPIYGALLALNKRVSLGWMFLPAPFLVGILGTGSRGPVIGLIVMVAALVFYLVPRARWWLAASTLGMLVSSIVFFEPIAHTLEKWVGEDKRVVEFSIHGETTKVSNLRARIALFEINKIAFKRSGLLGFGTTAVTGFPINVPVGPVEARALSKIRTVDNTYALLLLRFGYAGVGMFLAAGLLSLWQYFKLANAYAGRSVGWCCSALGAITCAAMVVQLSVWMPHEIGFPLVWAFGISAGLTYGHLFHKL